MTFTQLELTDWRRRVHALYAAVRAEADPAEGHAVWRAGREDLFLHHPQSPLPADDPLRVTRVRYWPYDPALRFTLPLAAVDEDVRLAIPTGDDGVTKLKLFARVRLPEPFDADLDVWWMDQYGGGLFIPLKDGTAGHGSYGAGRYALDTAKGADLGGAADSIVLDLNFLYHPSCRYSPEWVCPLAQPGNTISARVEAGEQL